LIARIEETCNYSCKKYYIEQGLQGAYAWEPIEGQDQTEENKLRSMREDNPLGRCVWQCDNNVVDHQTAIIEFADGSTASHNMNGGTSRPGRSIHLIGETGEIEGYMEDGEFVVRHPNAHAAHTYSEEKVDINVFQGYARRWRSEAGRRFRRHAPGQAALDFLDQSRRLDLRHLTGFAADRARIQHSCVDIVE